MAMLPLAASVSGLWIPPASANLMLQAVDACVARFTDEARNKGLQSTPQQAKTYCECALRQFTSTGGADISAVARTCANQVFLGGATSPGGVEGSPSAPSLRRPIPVQGSVCTNYVMVEGEKICL